MSDPTSAPSTSGRSVRIAVEGCCHGDLDRIYETIAELDKNDSTGKKIELLIICGDFQAVRNLDDLECLACPPKYRSLRQFYKYYSGEAVAPVLTLFVGGNHEASNHLGGLPLGGWVAPNIYYLGNAGVVFYKGLRIAGLSGIFNPRHYKLGRHERPPYDADSLRSAYHVREVDAWRLSSLAEELLEEETDKEKRNDGGGNDDDNDDSDDKKKKKAKNDATPRSSSSKAKQRQQQQQRQQRIDVFVSHDWPSNIARHGDAASLTRMKRHLASEVADGSLGSPPGEALLEALRPRYWFSAHLHVKFAALVRHGKEKKKKGKDEEEKKEGEGEEEEEDEEEETTRFLALDKCVPGRQFLQVLDVPVVAVGSNDDDVGGRDEGGESDRLCYDPHWLAVVSRSYASSESRRRAPVRLPPPPRPSTKSGSPSSVDRNSGRMSLPPPIRVSAQEVADVRKRLLSGSSSSPSPLEVPLNFEATAPPHGSAGAPAHRGAMPRGGTERNPQTLALLSKLGLPFVEDGHGPPSGAGDEGGDEGAAAPSASAAASAPASAGDAIRAAAERVAAAGGAPTGPSSSSSFAAAAAAAAAAAPSVDPAEIDIDDDDGDGDGDGGIFEDPGALHNMGQG